MQKRFLAMSVILLVMLAVVGCIPYAPESTPVAYDTPQYSENSHIGEIVACFPLPYLEFLSLEEFLDTYVAARGRGITPGSRTAIIAETIDLPSLDSIHLPTNIPETFRLARICVDTNGIALRFMPATKDFTHDFTNELWNSALMSNQYFLLMTTRHTYEDLAEWGHSSPLDGIMNQFGFTEDDLIDGKYYIQETFSGMLEIHWAHGSTRISLRMPRAMHESDNTVGFNAEGAGLVEAFTTHDILHFTETITIDLQDEANIAAWSVGDFSMLEDVLR